VAGLGILGVELFFVISGFVILMTVWGRGIGGFARSRVVRLFPAYWVSVLVVAGVYGLTRATALDPRLSTGEYAVNLTMLQRAFGVTDANGVYWSLWVELRFYLLIAVLVLVGVTMARCLVFMGTWLAATLAATFVEAGPIVDLVVMPKYAPYFIAGMALFLIRRFGSAIHLWAFVAAGFALALRSALQRVAGRVEAAGFKAMPVEDWMVVAAITLMFGVLAVVALGGLSRLTWGGLTTLGGLTYPLYLLHTPVAVVLVPALRDALPPWVVAAATTLAAVALSYAVYKLVERPVQRLFRPASRRGRTARRHMTT
jgi:peptidoglycan/LPS O-acetylase OafA/YrhL